MKEYDRTYGLLKAYYVDDFYNLLSKDEKDNISFKLYYNVIRVYVQIYFRDLYSGFSRPQYFFGTGMIKLCQQLWKGKFLIKYLWYHRINHASSMHVMLKSLKQKPDALFRILENDFENRFNISELQNHNKEFRKVLKELKLWRNADYFNTI